jgi:hypothetical protein
MKHLEESVKRCPVENRADLSRKLYWLGIALFKMGRRSLSTQAWLQGRRRQPRGRSRAMHRRFVNSYGMQRRSSEIANDFSAFFCIQLDRYLEARAGHQFSTPTEQEIIRTVITEDFSQLVVSGALKEKNAADKLTLFQKRKLAFPFIPAAFSSNCIEVDFFRSKKLDPSARCLCGSGLPNMLCCGRIKSPNERHFE